jgi:glycosyltransferase involved in cell wall biosynthesis
MPDHSKILSIIIPTYNSSKTIIQALDSFDYTRQDDFEICLIDDGSKEDIKDLIAPMMGRYPDTIKYFKKENGN